jgi:hypothetical protein
MRLRFSVLFTFTSLVFAGLGDCADPVVQLPYGSFRGQVVGATTQFLGMPFAAPPYVDLDHILRHAIQSSLSIALATVALVFQNLPYHFLASVMQRISELHAISKQWDPFRISQRNSLALQRMGQRIVWRTSL